MRHDLVPQVLREEQMPDGRVRQVIVYDEPLYEYPAPSPRPMYPQYAEPYPTRYVEPCEERHERRRSERKGRFAGIAVGWFLGSWLLALVSPGLTLAMWFIGIGYLVYRGVKAA